MLKNRKGMAVPTVLIVMLIVTVMGVALLNIAVGDNIHSSRDKSRMQAYYLARSGVEATEKWIVENVSDFDLIKDTLSDPATLPESGIDGTFTVEVSGDLANVIVLEGTGTVRGVTETAIKVLSSVGDILSLDVFDTTVYAKNLVVISGNSYIDGTVAYGGSLTTNGSVVISGGIPTEPVERILPPINFPADPSTVPDLDYVLNSDTNFTDLPDYNSTDQILVVDTFAFKKNGATLEVDTGGVGNVVKLVTRTFNFQVGTLEITGEGRFEIYVTELMDLQAGVSINETTYTGDPDGPEAENLLVLMGEGSSFNKAGSAYFSGYVYGPLANITLSGTTNMDGAVIGDNTTLGGDPFIASSDGSPFTFDDLPVYIIEDSSYINHY